MFQLSLQLIKPVKLLLITNAVDEAYMDLLAVEVAVEVEQVDLDDGVVLAAVADGGSVPDVGHGLVGLAFVVDETGIHASVTDEHVLSRQLKVGRREAQSAPDLVAHNDLGSDGIGVAQQLVGTLHIACGKSITNLRGANGNVLNILCGNAFHLEAIFQLHVVEQTEVAHAVLAEMVIVADNDIRRLDVVDDVVLDEDLGGRARKFLGEVDDDHVVDAELLKFLEFFLRRAEETQVGAVDVEHLPRMWTKSDHNGLTTNALCQGLHLVEDGLMAKMDAVKSADGDHGVGDIAGRYDIVKNIHCLIMLCYNQAAKIGKKWEVVDLFLNPFSTGFFLVVVPDFPEINA